MPRYTVHIRDEWLAVPCRDPTYTIQWLGYEALKRYTKNKPDNGGINAVKDIRFVARRCQGQGLLDGDDTIEDVLEDNDFVEIAIEGDTMSPDFIPYQPGVSHLTAAYRESDDYLFLDGNSLTSTDLVNLGRGLYKITLTSEAENGVVKSRELLDTIVKENKVVYGITTGFGKFARTVIPVHKLKELQENLVRSHSAGVGNPLSPERTRMLLALRINVLAKGYSGISLETLHRMIQAFNASCLSFVPEKGTVGASGDLAPLSHLALGLMGEGKMWSPKSGWADAKYVLEAHGLKPISLKPKEGLALINGTQMITSLGAEAVERAQAIARQADIIAAITLEVLKGTSKAFDSDIHALRPHPGQIEVAMRFRALLDSDHHPSEIAESHRFCDRVQDAYTMRCCPQVHGIVNDTIDFTQKIINTEINSATDNPMVFAERGETISGGNFHGEYPAKALDFLAIGVHELAAISERRIERLCNPSLSELPAFLVNEGGLNSGFMIAHCTAASLGRWWLVRSRNLRCGRFLRPLWTLRGPRRMLFEPSWTQGVGRGAFSTSWSRRGTVRRRDAGCRWRTFWTFLCCGSFTVSTRIVLRLVLRVIPEAGVGALLEPRIKGGGTVTTSAEVGPSPCSGGVWRSTSPVF
ncbi:histidine ammonia-lyase isoform X2 [Salvelinus sp. IW2-2015]|uniref:histidine ammonia-lyase isoform X2 n=1 Tax=Salvelinus sp. IW2-2015 TaxID=2691554 RepID=UPI0038D406EB